MLALIWFVTTADAGDRDHDRVPDHEDHCPDLRGPRGGMSPGCPDLPAPPAEPAVPAAPPERPVHLGGACLGVIQHADAPEVRPTDGGLRLAFHCDDGSFVDAVMPSGLSMPAALVTGRRGTLTWAPQRAFERFVGEDGGVVLPPVASPTTSATRSTPTPASPTPAPTAPTSPTPLFEDLSCAGQFGGVERPAVGASLLVFTCDGSARASYAFPDGATPPADLPAVGARATLEWTRYASSGGAPRLVWKRLSAGAATWKPVTLLDTLLEYGGE